MDTNTVVATTIDALGRRVAPRRHRPIEEKKAIVAETMKRGASVAEVARRHGVNANLVFVWRRLQERGLLETHTRRMKGRRLMPVKLLSEPTSRPCIGEALTIEWPGGMRLHVHSGAEVILLERVIELLRR